MAFIKTGEGTIIGVVKFDTLTEEQKKLAEETKVPNKLEKTEKQESKKENN